ncbi:hypothetical protein PspLS_03604 [Pyricularia sp. CBS 133598]|nr:hypothetical protein PspLS_03604 [Pyricularia sp. CBS 133598]
MRSLWILCKPPFIALVVGADFDTPNPRCYDTHRLAKAPPPKKNPKQCPSACTWLTNEDWGGDLGIRDRVGGLVQHGTAKVMHSVDEAEKMAPAIREDQNHGVENSKGQVRGLGDRAEGVTGLG